MAATVVPAAKGGYLNYLAEGYWNIFGKAWPVWLGGLLLGITNFALFAFAAPWFIFGGVNLGGSWLISFVGITPTTKLVSPWLDSGFMHDGAIIVGAFASCLLASSFRIRIPRLKIRLVDGFAGGLLMGVGAMLAPGCNIGGLFTAVSALSLSGFVMVFALGFGAYTGVRFARWRLKRDMRSGGMAKYESAQPLKAKVGVRRWQQPVAGVIILVASLVLVEWALGSGYANLGIYVLFGLAFGFILQRCGFCFTASFRDLFTLGDGRLARGTILAIAVATLGFAILVGTGIRKPFLLPVGWHTLVGGYVFGLGMVLAGGCASGMLFRIGEGSVQLLAALFGGALGASLFLLFRANVNFPANGPSIWLVDVLGWQGALFAVLGFLALWLLFVQWNEHRRRIAL